MDVCHPSLIQINGNPAIMVSGASTGSTYHHFVKIEKLMIVIGKAIFQMSRFTLFLMVHTHITSKDHDFLATLEGRNEKLHVKSICADKTIDYIQEDLQNTESE